MTSLQKDFNHFIYGLIGGEDLVALIKKEIPSTFSITKFQS